MRAGLQTVPRKPMSSALRARAFTLIELMLVVAIIGLVMTASVPSLYRLWHKEGFRKTLSDIVEVCGAARARAILMGVTAEVVFHPRDGKCELVGEAAPGSGILAHTATIEKDTIIDMLDVNLRECKDLDEVKVRFFPNGTCDEMILILRSDKGEQRGVVLEITTSLATLLNETDLQNLRKGRL
jgi:prepilin-type N-terminal cleavage/methylation domain-containing protein